jgi:hypothetical protein
MATKLNRSHIVHGKQALILPCLARTDEDQQAGGLQGVSVEDAMSMVHISYGIRKPDPPASRSTALRCRSLMAVASRPRNRVRPPSPSVTMSAQLPSWVKKV